MKKVMNKNKKTKAEFGSFPPPTKCDYCDGRGEEKDEYITRLFGSSNWTYKKCLHCNGSGKNLWHCIFCGELLHSGASFWCSNKNCKDYALMVALGNKQ